MARSNGKTETEARDLDLEHELPAAEETSEEQAQAPAGDDVSVLRGELEKAQAERNLLLDRMARLQAEFDNARKRSAREQQEYKDFALTDALKNLLPILDSFDRALQVAHETGLAKEEADWRKGKGSTLVGLGRFDAALAEYAAAKAIEEREKAAAAAAKKAARAAARRR